MWFPIYKGYFLKSKRLVRRSSRALRTNQHLLGLAIEQGVTRFRFRIRFRNFLGPCGPRPLGILYPFSYLIA